MTAGTSPRVPDTVTVSVVPATNAQFIRRIDELVDIHLAAMAYPPSTHAQRRSLWFRNASEPDFTCSVALLHQRDAAPNLDDSRQRSVGVAYSLRGTPESWWYRQVARGLLEAGHSHLEVSRQLHAYAELSEIHVSPAIQGRGIGKALLRDIIDRSPQNRILLSTPEVHAESNAAWRLYRSFGFTDVLRDFRFPSDPRPFGILELLKT